MGPTEVYGLRPEFKYFKYENFRTNLRALRNRIGKHGEKAVAEAAALAVDRAANPIDPTGRWAGSDAQRFFEMDMEAGVNNTMSLEGFWRSRASYQVFTKDKFRRRIHDWKSKQLQKPFWEQKKKELNEKSELRKAKKLLQDFQADKVKEEKAKVEKMKEEMEKKAGKGTFATETV